MNRKVELLLKVIAWRFFSMCYGFGVAFLFTGNIAESAGIVFITGTTLTALQWIFEIFWDKHIRSRLRHALSGQQGRVDRLVWWRRSARTVSVDKHEQGSNKREEREDTFSSQDVGKQWS